MNNEKLADIIGKLGQWIAEYGHPNVGTILAVVARSMLDGSIDELYRMVEKFGAEGLLAVGARE